MLKKSCLNNERMRLNYKNMSRNKSINNNDIEKQNAATIITAIKEVEIEKKSIRFVASACGIQYL